MRLRYARALLSALLITIGVISLAATLARPARTLADEPRYFAIRYARIVLVSGPVIEKGTVVIANGLIQAVGADVEIPAEAVVIDGQGLTVYPGLIDAGTDLGLQFAPSTKGPGASSADSGGPPHGAPAMGPDDRPATMPWDAAADSLKPDDKRIETWRNAGFTTALSLPKGGIFAGQAAIIDLAGDRAHDMVVKTPAALVLGFDPASGFSGFPDSLMGVIGYQRQVFWDAAWYDQAEKTYEAHPVGVERPGYDRTERVVGEALKSGEPVLMPANNQVQILRALRLAYEWNLHAVIYGGQEGYAVSDALAARHTPVLVNLKWPAAAKDPDPDEEASLRELRFRDRAPSTPAAFVRAGVKFGFYSDGLPAPKDIMKSIKKALDAGLTADAALRAFTLDAADILGVSDRLGSIQPGKIANLAITDGDIFNEKTKVKIAFVDGKRFTIHEQPEEKPDKDKDADKPALHAGHRAHSRTGDAR